MFSRSINKNQNILLKIYLMKSMKITVTHQSIKIIIEIKLVSGFQGPGAKGLWSHVFPGSGDGAIAY